MLYMSLEVMIETNGKVIRIMLLTGLTEAYTTDNRRTINCSLYNG